MDPITLHRAALDAFVRDAVAVEAAWWHTPLRDGGWTPAQVTEHLRLVYAVALRELRDGDPPRLKLSRFRRFVLRRTLVRRLLAGGPFPRGAPAPRELRPAVSADGSTPADAIAALQHWGATFNEEVAAIGLDAPRRLTHPYFGALPLRDMVVVLTRHIEHHRAQIAFGRATPTG
jgi:hypothetical protein